MKPYRAASTLGLRSTQASTFVASGLLAAWQRIEARSRELTVRHREPESNEGDH